MDLRRCMDMGRVIRQRRSRSSGGDGSVRELASIDLNHPARV